MPLQIECSTCGHKSTVGDDNVGRSIPCPQCRTLLVPLTPDKLENYAAKVLFAAPAATEEVIREEATGPEIGFVCPFCMEAYEVSADLAGKQIICRNCRQPSKVEGGAKPRKPRRARSTFSLAVVWLGILLSVFCFLAGYLVGRFSRL